MEVPSPSAWPSHPSQRASEGKALPGIIARHIRGRGVRPQHGSLRPKLGVEDHGVAVVLGVLVHDGRHFFQNPAHDLALLGLVVDLRRLSVVGAEQSA
jgi:hypothetical protein